MPWQSLPIEWAQYVEIKIYCLVNTLDIIAIFGLKCEWDYGLRWGWFDAKTKRNGENGVKTLYLDLVLIFQKIFTWTRKW